MIVRDAEETVGRAIKSALAIVDEVVVVDMGSVDNTRLIVEGYGSRVIEFDWDDDFAAARNAGIDAAYGDWILVLDADEVLDAIRPVEVGRMLQDDRALAYFARVSAEEFDTGFERVRLFRSDPQARYRFPVHERVAPALAEIAAEQGRLFRRSRLRIRREAKTGQAAQVSKARDLRLLNRALGEFPDEPWFRYQLARQNTAQYEESILPVKGFTVTLELLESAVVLVREMSDASWEHLGYVPDLYHRHASALLTAGRCAEAVATAEEGQRCCGDGPLLRFVHARALVARAAEIDDEKEVEALLTIASGELHILLRGLEGEGQGRGVAGERYYTAYPRLQLGHIAFARGEFDAAGEHYRTAMRECPDFLAALGGLARVARAQGRVREALQIYLKVIAIDDRDLDAWTGGARTQIELGFIDNARSWLARLEQVMPEHPGLPALLDLAGEADRLARASS